MPSWLPDWPAMRAEAVDIRVPPGVKRLYFIADAHLGDARSAPEPFLAMLRALPEAGMVIFLGDLFKVWLAPPEFWNQPVRTVLDGFRQLRAAGVPIVFVVGNREFLLPRNEGSAAWKALPFDRIVPEMALLHWGERRYGLTHGDIVNRRDRQYLRWRRLSRGPLVSGLFRAMPGGLARRLAVRLESSLAHTNREIKIQYPREELAAFAEAMAADTVPGGDSGRASRMDGYLIGHFHRDEVVPVPGRPDFLRIVPDWFSRKAVFRLDDDGQGTIVRFDESGRPLD